MCGIGLAIGPSSQQISVAVRALNAALVHRGPDDEGTHTLKTGAGLTLGLAHRRLSILDLSPTGHQPMLDEASGNAIVFNGEIYNHREIAADLVAKGERFIGTSDTEVLLKAYKHFSANELLRRLRGMFAFALWDAARQKILVARDPCGIKPLYYTAGKDFFACASEARALVRAGFVDGSLDPLALDSFLAFGSVQTPLSIFRGVSSLLPGQMMWVSGDGIAEAPVTYWKWRLHGADGGPAAIAHWLQESVRRHLVADVPVAVFLSGGFDSTALAALAMQVSEAPVSAFTMGFPEVPEMSEVRAAAAIAARLGAEHHILELRESELQGALPVFFGRMDQPSDDGLNVYLISHGVARAGIKACLHGVGGDELFGGYPSFVQLPTALRLSAIPASLRRLLAGVVAGDSVARSKLANLLRSDLSLLDAFLVRRSVFSFEQRRALLGGEPPLGRSGVPEAWTRYVQACLADAGDTFATISMLELAQYAVNKLLADGDVMSMAHGLELRFPLLDVDLIRAVLATPGAAKRNKDAAAGKPLLTGSVRNFPFDLVNRKKQGFTLPLAHWLRKGLRDERQAFMQPLVEDMGLQPGAVEAVWRRFDASNGGQEWLRAWLLYALGGWLRQNAGSTACAFNDDGMCKRPALA